ncbi:hypothetical protein C0416_02680 [bacterium]|nr:hypothetical protein [bacterium]
MSDTQPSSEKRTFENVEQLNKGIIDALEEEVKSEHLGDGQISKRDIAKKVLSLIIRETAKNHSIEITNFYVNDAIMRVLNSPGKKIRLP